VSKTVTRTGKIPTRPQLRMALHY